MLTLGRVNDEFVKAGGMPRRRTTMQNAHQACRADVPADIYAAATLLAGAQAPPRALAAAGARPLPYAPPRLRRVATLGEAARRLCLASLWQLCGNLLLLCESDDAEIVHQARIGWRRWRGDLRLLRAFAGEAGAPRADALRPMVRLLGRLRDLDVARLQVLPAARGADVAAQAVPERQWQRLLEHLDAAARSTRAQLRALLLGPAVGAGLWRQAQWAAGLGSPPGAGEPSARPAVRAWARRRVAVLRRKLKRAQERGDSAPAMHRCRIRAKRLRYASEELRVFLPRKAARWHAQALQLQTRLGRQRDLANSAELAAQLGAPAVAAYLRRLG